MLLRLLQKVHLEPNMVARPRRWSDGSSFLSCRPVSLFPILFSSFSVPKNIGTNAVAVAAVVRSSMLCAGDRYVDQAAMLLLLHKEGPLETQYGCRPRRWSDDFSFFVVPSCFPLCIQHIFFLLDASRAGRGWMDRSVSCEEHKRRATRP